MKTRQMNINVTPEFEADLKLYMEQKGCANKSEALRAVLREAVRPYAPFDWNSVLGCCRAEGMRPDLREDPTTSTFDDELWGG